MQDKKSLIRLTRLHCPKVLQVVVPRHPLILDFILEVRMVFPTQHYGMNNHFCMIRIPFHLLKSLRRHWASRTYQRYILNVHLRRTRDDYSQHFRIEENVASSINALIPSSSLKSSHYYTRKDCPRVSFIPTGISYVRASHRV